MNGYTFDVEAGIVFGLSGRPITYVDSRGYVCAKRRGRYVGLAHRMLWQHVHGSIPDGMEIDHINGVRTDNRISNLRLCTASQNQMNRHARQGRLDSKGVALHPSGKYQAQIKVDGKSIYLGLFSSEQEAAGAYRSASLKHFGEFSSFRKAA